MLGLLIHFLILRWLAIRYLHLEIFRGHAPKIAGWSGYGLLFFDLYLEIIHTELPGEEHAIVAFAFRIQFILYRLISSGCMALVFLRLLLEVFWATEAAGHSIRTILQIRKLPLNGSVKFLQNFLFLIFTEVHFFYC